MNYILFTEISRAKTMSRSSWKEQLLRSLVYPHSVVTSMLTPRNRMAASKCGLPADPRQSKHGQGIWTTVYVFGGFGLIYAEIISGIK
jgi:hypothetical protein